MNRTGLFSLNALDVNRPKSQQYLASTQSWVFWTEVVWSTLHLYRVRLLVKNYDRRTSPLLCLASKVLEAECEEEKSLNERNVKLWPSDNTNHLLIEIWVFFLHTGFSREIILATWGDSTVITILAGTDCNIISIVFAMILLGWSWLLSSNQNMGCNLPIIKTTVVVLHLGSNKNLSRG